MLKRKNLPIILYPIAAYALSMAAQDFLYFAFARRLIAEPGIAPWFQAAQMLGALALGGIAITRADCIKPRPQKRLLLLLGILAALLSGTMLALALVGNRFRDAELATAWYLFALLGSALTLQPRRKVEPYPIATLSAGFLALWATGLLLSTVYRMRFGGPVPQPPHRLFLVLHIGALIALGAALGALAHRPVQTGRVAIFIFSLVVTFTGGFYVLRLLLSLFPGGIRIGGEWLNRLEAHHVGFRQGVLFLAGWHASLLWSLRPRGEVAKAGAE